AEAPGLQRQEQLHRSGLARRPYPGLVVLAGGRPGPAASLHGMEKPAGHTEVTYEPAAPARVGLLPCWRRGLVPRFPFPPVRGCRMIHVFERPAAPGKSC